MVSIDCKQVYTVVWRIGVGQVLSFVMSLTGMITTLMVNNNTSYSVFQSATSYLAILAVYMPLYLYVRHRYRNQTFSNFCFMNRWWKYVIQAVIDLEANYLIVLAYQYTNILSAQLFNCMTVPTALLLSFVILRMRFLITHILGAVIAVAGLCLLIAVDADGVSRDGQGSNPILGDVLCCFASILYASSNVLMEWFIKPSPTMCESVGRSASSCDAAAASSMQKEKCDDKNTAANASVEQTGPEADGRARCGELSANAAEGGARPVPMVVPVIENLAILSLAGFVLATVQFFIVDWESFRAGMGTWSTRDTGCQIGFSVSMLVVYTVLPIVFLSSSAAFANVSLMTTVMYGIIWYVTIFDVFPKKLFIVSYAVTAVGIVVYDLSDRSFFRRCGSWIYPCGRPTRLDIH